MKELIQVEDQHYILATEAHDDRTRVLKHGDTFGLFDRHGNIRPTGLKDQGLYHDGTRFLSRLELRINGRRPLLLSSSVVDDGSLLAVDLTNPDIEGDELIIHRGQLHLFRARFLDDHACYERLRVRNYGRAPVALELALELEADFRDVFEVRGSRRRRRGGPPRTRVLPDGLSIEYVGLDGVRRISRIRCSPAPKHAREGEIRFDLRLRPGEEQTFYVDVECAVGSEPAELLGFEDAFAKVRSEITGLEDIECRIGSSSGVFNEWLERSVNDLRMMVTHTDEGLYPYAGVPWYSTVFGRDGIITALQALWLNPSLAAGVLRFLAANQATAHENERDAEPGKILHELRSGEMAALGEIPFGRYYGTVDATPLFVVLAGEYHRATDDRELSEKLWPHVERALEWMARDGDPDRDGFVEYQRRSATGLVNQGWKDSLDSVFHKDGELAQGPIALCEVQGYAYQAYRSAAGLAAALGMHHRASSLEREAELLRERFERAFWCEELSTYALALDGEKRPCRVRTSNVGHCLFTGIASQKRAHEIARGLFSPAFYSGWGVRTVAEGEARYNPMSYHNGSVWPHDNAIIAAGLARYGFKHGALKIFQALFEASAYFELRRVPELFCGFVRRPGEGPTLYPVACSPQAWASGAVLMLLQACLGLEIDARARTIRLTRPVLPPFLDELRLERLKVGPEEVDLIIHRYPEGAGIDVKRRTGGVQLTVIK